MIIAGWKVAPLPVAGVVAGALIVARWLGRRGSAAPLGDAIVRAARADLNVREVTKNDGPRIREYFAESGINPPANWCAASTTTWVREAAAALGLAPPIAGSMQAKKIGDQLRELSASGAAGARWFTAEDIRRDPSLLLPGDAVIWDRSDPAKPETSWYGHVGVVASPASARSFTTIEGNSGQLGDRVAEMTRSVDDPRLIGAGRAWAPGRATTSAARVRGAAIRATYARPQFVPPAPWWEAA